MNAVELEQYLTQFLQQGRDAKRRYEEAVALEQYPNEATQDILHTIELAPRRLIGVDVARILHELRAQRREAKKELEVTDLFNKWATENKKALDTLEQVLGQMRKVLRRQPNDAYCYKTGIIAAKGSWLRAEPEVNVFDDIDPNQITMEEIADEQESGN